MVLLKRHRGQAPTKQKSPHICTRPLQRGGGNQSKSAKRRAIYTDDELIGRKYGDFYNVNDKGKTITYQITEPSLDEYVTLSPRLVTPVSSHLIQLRTINI